jgi:23S rRNA (cytidine1920-2'-O)/16S rRNA (cytidine1409-2'-O)-methyltransferase
VRVRLDRLLVDRGLAPSRERAQRLILAGAVLVEERPVTKPGAVVAADARLRLRGAPAPYVSRGGEKLAGALDAFGLDVRGRVALDVGASTGGFTDCLLRRGARRVIAVDVGYGQLAWSLRQDPRVVVLERVNARHLAAVELPETPDLATIDVAFISLALVLPAVAAVLAPGSPVVALVKPQFEVGRGQVGKGGVVRDPGLRAAAVARVRAAAAAAGLCVGGEAESVLPGPKGNREVFLLLAKPLSRSPGDRCA